MSLCPYLDNYKESLSTISVFIFCLFPTLHFSTTNSVQVSYTYNRKSWLSPSVRANSSFPKESKELKFHSLEKSNIEILLILSPPSLFLNPIEKGVIHLIGKIFENLISIRAHFSEAELLY